MVASALGEELFGKGLFGLEAWRALRDASLVVPFYFRLFDDVLAREAEQAEELLQRCLNTEQKEAEMMAQIASGTYKGAYAAK